jgi:hypothetical protein
MTFVQILKEAKLLYSSLIKSVKNCKTFDRDESFKFSNSWDFFSQMLDILLTISCLTTDIGVRFYFRK